MLFGKKKKEAQPEKKKLLYRENIKTGCTADTQEHVIRQVGQMLSVIADKMLAPDSVEKIVNGDVNTVYKMLSGEE